MTPNERVTTEIVHVVQENGDPKIVVFKSKNGGSVRLFKLDALTFDEVKLFLEDLTRTPAEKL